MPGDTKIRKTQNGWIDVDEPTKPYGARRLARDARRFRLQGRYASLAALNSVPTISTVVPAVAAHQDKLTGLQSRLVKRLTLRQGVSGDEALEVIKANGYNAAASYGHMRVAGASHDEALTVINIGLPDVSLSYGISRASGEDHTVALRKALLDDDD